MSNPGLLSNIRATLDLLLPGLKFLHQTRPNKPVILGITGLQGSGKSTWSNHIVQILTKEHNLRAITISLDDLYKTHDDLVARREKDPGNRLYRTRGQPGTHDEALACEFFSRVSECGGGEGEGVKELRIPIFDKSRFGGEGDRVPEAEWPRIRGGIDVVVFEGWCIGFRAFSESDMASRYKASALRKQEDGVVDASPESTDMLTDHKLEHLLEVNRNLRRYNEAFMGPQHFDFMIHIDTDDLKNVYRWRAEQEEALIKGKGEGMSYEAVAAFVRGYMPAYELYLDGLRAGFFEPGSRRQIRVVLSADRELESTEAI